MKDGIKELKILTDWVQNNPSMIWKLSQYLRYKSDAAVRQWVNRKRIPGFRLNDLNKFIEKSSKNESSQKRLKGKDKTA